LELFTESTSCAVEVCKKCVQHHPYEHRVEGFFRLAGCLCKYLMLYLEKLLELYGVMAVRIGEN